MTPAEIKPVRLAVVGCGMMTESAHLPAILRSPLIELAAFVDNDLKRADLLNRKYGCGARAATSLEAVISSVDGVLLVTPNHTHRQLTEFALNHGVHVLVQKPMATNFADAEALCSLAAEKGLVLAVGFQGRHFASIKLMKRLIEDGYFGRITKVDCEFGVRGGYASASGYNLSREQAGGGVLVTMGSHYVDRMLYWFGDPVRVAFADDSYGGVEGNCKGAMYFADGVEGTFFFSKAIALKNKFVFHSERAVVELPASETERLIIHPHDMPGMKMELGEDKRGPVPDYQQVEMEDFAISIRTGKRPVVDGVEGARSVKVTDDLYACRTQLPEPWAWYRMAAAAGVAQ